MTERAKETVRSPITIAAIAGASLMIALGVMFFVLASDDASTQDLKHAQQQNNLLILQSSKANCSAIEDLRDAAAKVVERSGNAVQANPRYSAAEKARLAAFYGVQQSTIESVECVTPALRTPR